VYFNCFSWLLIFAFHCRILLCFNCCHHASVFPLKLVATKNPPIIKYILEIQYFLHDVYSNLGIFRVARNPKNFGMSSLNPTSHLLVLFGTNGHSILTLCSPNKLRDSSSTLLTFQRLIKIDIARQKKKSY
jgi:hypothetical protein